MAVKEGKLLLRVFRVVVSGSNLLFLKPTVEKLYPCFEFQYSDPHLICDTKADALAIWPRMLPEYTYFLPML